MLKVRPLQKDHHEHARERHNGGQRTYVQGDQQAGGGLAHVGAHDEPDGLIQVHDTGVDKAHHHDGSGGGGLDCGGDERAQQDPHKPVGSEPLQDGLHPVAGCGLQAGAHHLHPVEKQRQAAKQAEKFQYVHM